jgi:uncharacterized membrane protein
VLSVRIPNNAAGGTIDNIQVIAQSKYDNTKSDNKICMAQVTQIRRGVAIRISPTEGTAGPGENLTFTVTVTNTGNVADNYRLIRSDIAVPSWGPTLDNYSLENVPAGANKTTTLRITVPSGAVNNAQDNVTITARSRTDNTIENSASCTAQAVGPVSRGVSVSISPSSQSGAKGATLTYTITVSNTGNDLDTFDLTASDDHGWELQLDTDTLTIPSGEDTTANLSVTVPSDAKGGDSDLITITATSEADPTKSASDNCTATATVPGGLLPVAVGAGAVVIGGAAITVALLVKKGVIDLSLSRLRSRQLRFNSEGLKSKLFKILRIENI